MSPFLMRLDHEWKNAGTVQERGEIDARRAGYLARIGSFEGAKTLVLELRKVFGTGRDGRVTIWIMVAEALIYHFEKIDPVALDRITRAQLLSRMINDHQLEAISSAWKAHIEFESSQFEQMFGSLRIAVTRAQQDNYEAHSRISNIIFKVAVWCGREEVAKIHFRNGREYALKIGDQAGIEALQHNRAAFRLARIRASNCLEQVGAGEFEQLRVEIETARSLQNLTGVKALSSYIDLCHARLLLLQGKYVEAVEALSYVRDSGPFPAGGVSPQLLDLDISYCLCAMDRLDEAQAFFKSSQDADILKIDPDERLVARWMQLQLARKSSLFGVLSTSTDLFDEAVLEYKKLMNSLQVGLDALDSF